MTEKTDLVIKSLRQQIATLHDIMTDIHVAAMLAIAEKDVEIKTLKEQKR